MTTALIVCIGFGRLRLWVKHQHRSPAAAAFSRPVFVVRLNRRYFLRPEAKAVKLIYGGEAAVPAPFLLLQFWVCVPFHERAPAARPVHRRAVF